MYLAIGDTATKAAAGIMAIVRRRSAPDGNPCPRRTGECANPRGLEKSYGERLRECGTQQSGRETTSGLSTALREALQPLLQEVESHDEKDRNCLSIGIQLIR